MKLSNNMYKPVLNQKNSVSGKNVNFKGMSSILYKTTDDIVDYDKLLKIASNEIGDAGDKLLSKLSKSNKINIANNKISFQEPTFIKQIVDNFAFPIIELPFLLADSALKLFKKIPGISKGADALYNLSFLKNHREAAQLAADSNMLRGILESTKKLADGKSLDDIIKKGSDQKIGEGLFSKANKYFSPKTGNYNTAHERGLNRLVTGMASAFFLADDAYNLSVLCGDKTDESQKEKKARFKQERSRVFTTAYLQFAIMGAFSKLVNNKAFAAPLISAFIVLFSETTSRIRNGKPVFFLTPEKAKLLNAKKNAKNQEDKPQATNNSQPQTVQTAVAPVSNTIAPVSKENVKVGVSAFDKIAQPINGAQTSFKADSKNPSEKVDSKKDKQESKTLFSFKSLMKAVGGLAIAGLGLSYFRHNPKFEKNAINKALNSLNDWWSKSLYPSLVKKDFSINVADYDKAMKNLEQANKPLAARYRDVIEKFGVVDSDTGVLRLKDIAKKQRLLKELGEDGADKNAQKIADIAKKDFYTQVDKKTKPLVDLAIYPFKFVFTRVLPLPFKIVSPLLKIPAISLKNKQMKLAKDGKNLTEFQSKFVEFAEKMFGKLTKEKKQTPIQEVFTDGIEKLVKKSNDLTANKINQAQFKDFVDSSVARSFNNVTSSNVDNADLAKFVKLASSTVTSTFLVADNYNMVMQKSNGEDKEGAKQSAKERIVQRISSLFYQTMFIDLFNNTFSKLYHKALLGMCSVSTSSQIVMELFTRKSIGMPLGPKTYDELVEIDEKNNSKKGFAGAYFRFMSKLTGKKPLKKKTKDVAPQNVVSDKIQSKTASTNLLEMALNK